MDTGITVFIDSWCPHCKRFGEWVKRRDSLKKVEIKDIRSNLDSRIDIEKALTGMASIDERGNVMYGFSSIALIVKYLPFFKSLHPLLSLPIFSRIGNFLYNEFAVRRKIIPLHCEEADRCQLSQEKDL